MMKLGGEDGEGERGGKSQPMRQELPSDCPTGAYHGFQLHQKDRQKFRED